MTKLTLSIVGFLLGIALGSFFEINFYLVLFVILLSLGIFLSGKFSRETTLKVSAVVFLMLGMICGFSRIYFSNLREGSRLELFEGQKISAKGIVVDEPDVRDKNTKLTVKVLEAKAITSEEVIARPKEAKSQSDRLNEKVLISVPLYPEFHYGDLISFTVKLDKPKEIESEDGRVFDYKNYLRVRGIWYTGGFAKVELISVGHGSYIKNSLYGLKKLFTGAIERVIPAPESSLLSGLLLGAKQSLGRELLDEFSRAGVSHVVVLSGYNITIVAESVMKFLSFLSATMSFWIGCVVIILFTLLSGGGASAWRSALMVLVALFVRRGGRQFNAGYALALVVVLMLLWNPLLLIFDPSFQLSVLATIGIVFVAPIIEPYFSRVTEKYGMRLSSFSKTAARALQSKALGEIFSATISTQLIVLPYLIYSNGIFSIVALPVNILILGTVPATMFLGFITGVLGIISSYLSFIPALPTSILLWYQLAVVHIGATLPFGWFALPTFSMWVVVIVYILIIFGLRRLKKNEPAGSL